MKVSVLVPRRADGGRRDELWAWVKARWDRLHPEWPVIEGRDEGDHKFNRSAAINRAASESDADVFVIGDADSFVGPEQVNLACRNALAPEGPEFVIAYDLFNYLGKNMSDRIMAGFEGWWAPGIEWTMAGTCSSMIVVTRRLFEDVQGFDEGFQGWGFEDIAFSLACQTLGGGVSRIPGDAWHLWHLMSPENNATSPEWNANRERHLLYRDVAYDQPGMRALIERMRCES